MSPGSGPSTSRRTRTGAAARPGPHRPSHTAVDPGRGTSQASRQGLWPASCMSIQSRISELELSPPLPSLRPLIPGRWDRRIKREGPWLTQFQRKRLNGATQLVGAVDPRAEAHRPPCRGPYLFLILSVAQNRILASVTVVTEGQPYLVQAVQAGWPVEPDGEPHVRLQPPGDHESWCQLSVPDRRRVKKPFAGGNATSSGRLQQRGSSALNLSGGGARWPGVAGGDGLRAVAGARLTPQRGTSRPALVRTCK
ncbi:hypothetical protein BJY27_001840 [Streptomyces rapamycinicus]|uniref:Uncharacterized protein n=2 Tax=Streptomyces rapamycinicus TaxID=1226757 RepID=A0A3L8R434_STRRN|nr:hypothetical protein [Streptomyces rapamycinicus]RLV74474.1 hypothetical protein D3C57_134650 [Streptomyces rapamycinicus NRRL 5491]